MYRSGGRREDAAYGPPDLFGASTRGGRDCSRHTWSIAPTPSLRDRRVNVWDRSKQSARGDACVSNSAPIARPSQLPLWGRRQPDTPEGSVASRRALGEAAHLSPDEALQRPPDPRLPYHSHYQDSVSVADGDCSPRTECEDQSQSGDNPQNLAESGWQNAIA